MKYFGIHLFLFLFLPFCLAAQNDSVRINKNYLKKYWIDTKGIVLSPAHWDKTDWQRVGAFVGTTGALFFVDQPVNTWMQDHRTSAIDHLVKYGLEPFDIEYTIATCGLLYTGSLLFKNEKLKSTALLAFESYALASIFVRIPKNIIGRARPNSSDDASPFDFNGPFKGASFPSGHTIAVFSVATVIANQYRETFWVPVLSYSIAGLTGISRVYDNHHWLSDVFAGAVLGIAVGNFVCPTQENSRLSISPARIGSSYGVRLAYKL